MTYTLHLGDCLDVLKTLPDASVDAVVTDPPYELGFMGKKWDAAGIAYNVNLWTETLRVLKPGGHLLAFGGTRTYHRMACAIEDAGFEVRDSLHWLYGSGFPKSLNLKDEWQGWGTALKPAHEPVVVARKPLVGTVADNVQTHGTGALNIDGCRVGTDGGGTHCANRNAAGKCLGHANAGRSTSGETFHGPDTVGGRWPPNILLSHTPECGEACAEDCAVAEMDEQSGASVSRKGKPRGSVSPGDGWGMTKTGAEYNDSGGASRFFPVFRYQAKASRSERERGLSEGQKATHPTVKPVELMRWLVRLVTPPNGVVLDPFTGSGTTGVAAVSEDFCFVGIEREAEYHAIATARIQHALPQQAAQMELLP